MVQTKEEKSARRKARREKRKDASNNLAPKVAVNPLAEQDEVQPVKARRPYSGFQGTLFEKFTDESNNNAECYRIYTDRLNVLGVVEYDHNAKDWFIFITRFPMDWDHSARFPSLDLAMRCLYEHYRPLVTKDLGATA
jgi:hypothetical protein